MFSSCRIQCGGASLYDTVLRMVGLGRDFASPPTSAVSSLYLALKRGEVGDRLHLNRNSLLSDAVLLLNLCMRILLAVGKRFLRMH